MLPGGTDPGYRELLAGPHEPFTRVEVWRQGVRIDEYGDDGLPFGDGGIGVTLGSQVTRQLSLVMDESFYPTDPDGLLAPYGNELRVFQGVRPGSGVPYEWQTFRGRIQDTVMNPDGSTGVQAADRASDVKESGLLRPENSRVGYPVVDEFRRIVLDAVPDATFGTFDPIATITPALTWESDRGSACDDLSSASSAYWYALANGDFVMRFIPWTRAQTAVVEWADGAGGTLASATPRLSRDNVYNSIIVVGERADGTPPVYGLSQDLDPASATYIAGAFGVKTLLVQAQAASNQAQASQMARTTLRYAKALTQSWNVLTTCDPSLELGDCVGITARGLARDVQVVDSFALSLVPTSPMAVSLRALRPGSFEVAE
jgi:hypothetical protein